LEIPRTGGRFLVCIPMLLQWLLVTAIKSNMLKHPEFGSGPAANGSGVNAYQFVTYKGSNVILHPSIEKQGDTSYPIAINTGSQITTEGRSDCEGDYPCQIH